MRDCSKENGSDGDGIMTKIELTIMFIAQAIVFLLIAVTLQMIYMR